MILSRLYYVVLSLLVGIFVFGLAVAKVMYNRAGERSMRESLLSDASAVDWYLRDDSRKRSATLIPLALAPEVRTNCAKASAETGAIKGDVRDKTRQAISKLVAEIPQDLRSDAIWVVDASGRVVTSYVTAGKTGPEDWDLGGYAVVADALHGWIRDDAWVWDGRIYRVVARPVEQEASGEPVGAIIAGKVVDDAFAKTVSKRTNAAIGFFAGGSRVASGAPEEFGAGNLDQLTKDLAKVESDDDYKEKGRSNVVVINDSLGVVFSRMPGEAWDQGAGYAVGRNTVSIASIWDFFDKSSSDDKGQVPWKFIVPAVLAAAIIGLLFTVFEHTTPLSTFRKEAARMAKGEVDVLQPSRFRGVYKKIAADLNDGVEKVVAKGGVPRRAANLEQVLGPIPQQPAMSAFSVPGASDGAAKPPPSSGGAPRPPLPPKPADMPSSARFPVSEIESPGTTPGLGPIPAATPSSAGRAPPPPRRAPPPPGSSAGAPPPVASSPGLPLHAAPSGIGVSVSEGSVPGEPPPAGDELVEWQRVFQEFVAVKQQCGEPTNNLTFDKFRVTLQKNKDALVARHACSRVRFTVYVKEGKAALKASPVK